MSFAEEDAWLRATIHGPEILTRQQLAALITKVEQSVPPESERKVVRRLHGQWSTVTLSRCREVFFVTLHFLVATTPDVTLRVVPKVKAEALEGARLVHRLMERTGQLATEDAAYRNTFSKS